MLGTRCPGGPTAPCPGGGPITGAAGPSVPEGGAATDADAGEGTVTGEVLAYRDTSFLSTVPFTLGGQIGGDGIPGRVTAEFSSGNFEIDDVRRQSLVWMDVTDLSSPSTYVSTIQPVDTRAGDVILRIVPFDVLDQIAKNLALPTDINLERAQAILRFVNIADLPLSGIRITQHSGETLAYDTGTGLFRDDVQDTAQQGLVAILNAEAVALPGALAPIGYAGPDAEGTFDIRLARGSVTVVTVVLDD